MGETIRVMIVDDHAIVREGLRTLLLEEPEFGGVADLILRVAKDDPQHSGFFAKRVKRSRIVLMHFHSAFRRERLPRMSRWDRTVPLFGSHLQDVPH